MSTQQTNFTPNEWTSLLLAPIEAGTAVLLSGHSGMVGTTQEMIALYKATNKSAAQQYPGNRLVQSVLNDESKEARSAMTQKVSSYITDQSARQNVKNEALHTCQEVSSTL
ncbi:MAG: hypothetical protein J2P37_25410, partial [Ktedonobacteraceae bacterium]|nr:hypothetical protein [Ktedonobacteraceae bacterium]